MDIAELLSMGFGHPHNWRPEQLCELGMEPLTTDALRRFQNASVRGLRSMMCCPVTTYWDLDSWAMMNNRGTIYNREPRHGSVSILVIYENGFAVRYKLPFHDLLWPEWDYRHELGNRFDGYIQTFLDAATVALAAMNHALNLHFAANGRMLFELNEENIARLLTFLFHRTRAPYGVLFQGVPGFALRPQAKANLPSWMRTASLERQLVSKVRATIMRNIENVSYLEFRRAVERRLKATGLPERELPSSNEVVEESMARLMSTKTDPSEDPIDDLLRVDTSSYPEIEPVLNGLYALYECLTKGPLEDRLVALNALNAEVKEEARESANAAIAQSRLLRAAAERAPGIRTLAQLAQDAEARAKILSAQERTYADVIYPFCIPLMSAPNVVLDCETMRDALLSLNVQVPSLEECQADELGFFSRVFQIRHRIAEGMREYDRRVQFDGIIEVGLDIACVHCVFEEFHGYRGGPRPRGRVPAAGAPGAARGGGAPGNGGRR